MTAVWGHAMYEGIEASADLSSYQYYFVELTSGQLQVVGTLGNQAVGVLTDKPDAQGKIGQVCRFGGVKVVAGEAISVGDKITAGADGKAEVVSPTGAGGDAGYAVLGEARSAATADGQIISAIVNCINPPCAANQYA